MPVLEFHCVSADGRETRRFDARALVLAGWTGRDQAALQHHIDELAALGVAPPSRTPIYYRCGVDLVTQTDRLQVLGPDTSGEIEFVLLAFEDGLWLTVGSDQTDRAAEAIGVALSKQLAGKVLAKECWRLEDVVDGWDAMTLQAWATIDGARTLYQDATLAMIREPLELVAGHADGPSLATGTVLMSGTPPALGGIRPATRFEMVLSDPKRGRSITHAYDIDVLPVIA